HGTTMGALSINGIAALRAPFEPLVPDVVHVRNTCRYHRPARETEEEFTAFLLDDLEAAIVAEGPETVAMVMMEPVQNAGGALKNIEIMKRERIVERVRENEDAFRATLSQLLDLPIVGDLRGAGYFWALELVKDKETKAGFSDEESETLLRDFLSPRFFEKGLICRADDRGDPVVQISPPLIAGQSEFGELVGILGDVLAEAWERI